MSFSIIYIESQIRNHPNVARVIKTFPNRPIVEINHYGEVFNPTNQDFKRQKQSPSIILAKKSNNLVLKTPETFGIGGDDNYYFSHMLNCPYDCRYCFLQGMFNSSNYVIFVNYEDFQSKIEQIDRKAKDKHYFFSGYDADSLAFDHVTNFTDSFVPFFADLKNSYLELRTKSTQIRTLLNYPASNNIIVAFSFTPMEISRQIEHKVPSFDKRIAAIAKLVEHGYKIGLRFDPLIYCDNFKELYTKMFAEIFSVIPKASLHSISLGRLRFPNKMYDKIYKMYPDDALLNYKISKDKKYSGYSAEIENEMFDIVSKLISNYASEAIIFKCYT